MASPIKMAAHNKTNDMPDQNRVSETGEDTLETDIAILESSYSWLTNINLGLLILAGVIALAIGIVSVLATRKGEELIRAKDEQLSRETVQAKANIATAQAEAAKANLKTAELERQNLELREKVASRRITEAQHRILIDELSKHRTTFNMEMMGDPESGIFAADILKTFADAGWTVDKKEFPLGIIWIGLVLFQTKDPAFQVVSNALKRASIPFTIGDQSRDKITIMIGGKPPIF